MRRKRRKKGCKETRGDRERTRHLLIGDRVGENLGEVEKDSTTFVENLDARINLEVFYGVMERSRETSSPLSVVCREQRENNGRTMMMMIRSRLSRDTDLERQCTRDVKSVRNPRRNSGRQAYYSLFPSFPPGSVPSYSALVHKQNEKKKFFFGGGNQLT